MLVSDLRTGDKSRGVFPSIFRGFEYVRLNGGQGCCKTSAAALYEKCLNDYTSPLAEHYRAWSRGSDSSQERLEGAVS